MNIQFQDKDPQDVLTKIKNVMGDRQLSKMVAFALQDNEMVVSISKLGTSTLHFTCRQTPEGCHFTLSKEKIALAHRPMKSEVTSKIIKVIEQAGGVVQAS